MIFACAQLDSGPPATTLVVDIFSGPFLVKTLLLSQTTTEGLPRSAHCVLARYRCITVRRRSRAALRSSQVFLDRHLLCVGRQSRAAGDAGTDTAVPRVRVWQRER